MNTETLEVPLGPTGSDDHPSESFPPAKILVSWSPERITGHAWLHHGFARNPSHLERLTIALTDAGFLVARPHVSSFRRPRTLNDGPFLTGVIRGYATAVGGGAVSDLVGHDVAPLGVVMIGHSAGGAVVVHQGAALRTGATTPREPVLTVRGVVLLDANESLSKLMEPALGALADLPILLCSARPHRCNRQAMVSGMLLERREGFVGAMFTSGGHCDAEGSADLTCRAMCGGGAPDPANVAALHGLCVAWAADCAGGVVDPHWRPGGEEYDELVETGRIRTLAAPPEVR